MNDRPIEMVKVSAAEFQRNIGRYQDLALTQPFASGPSANETHQPQEQTP